MIIQTNQGAPSHSNTLYQNQQNYSMTKNPFQHTSNSLNQTAQSSFVICSKADESRFLKEQEEKNRIERIKQVRNQEKEASRMKLIKAQEKQQREKNQQEEELKYQEHLRKKQEIEELMKQRDIEIQRAGKAMRDAEEVKERSIRAEIEKRDKAIRDEKNKKVRGKEAIEKERQWQKEKLELEEEIKKIERKKQVILQETELAHSQAQKYREQESIRSQMMSQQQSTISGIQQISKMTNKADKSIASRTGQLDYTNTRFHNQLITRQDHEQVYQEELECAYEKAKLEQTKRNIEKAQKENQKFQMEQRAKARGQQALQSVITKKDKEIYEKEMKKIQMKEGWEKIQAGLKDKTNLNMAQNEKNEKNKKVKLENAFEQEFFNPNTEEQSTQENAENFNGLNVPQPQRLNIRIGEDPNQMQQYPQMPMMNFYPPQLQYQQNPQVQLDPNIANNPYMYNQYLIQMNQQEQQYNPYAMNTLQQQQMTMNNNPYQQMSSDKKQNIDHSQSEVSSNQDETHDQNSQYLQKSRLDQASNIISPQSDQQQLNQSQASSQHSQQSLQDQASFYKQQLLQYQQQLTQQQQTFQTSGGQAVNMSDGSPFFVPYPNENGPSIAPTSTAMPQHYNPYLEEIKMKEQKDLQENSQINIKLNHPKEQQKPNTLVDEFLQENRNFLQQDEEREDEEDSELPSDFEDEEDRDDISDVTGSQISSRYGGDDNDQQQNISSDVRSSSRTNNEQDFIKHEINNIIAEAKCNNQYLNFLDENKKYMVPSESSQNQSNVSGSQNYNNKSESSNNESDLDSSNSSCFSDKYLNSNYDQSKMQSQMKQQEQKSFTTSYLADEFLQDFSNSKSNKNQYSELSQSNMISDQGVISSGKTSYLKNSKQNQSKLTDSAATSNNFQNYLAGSQGPQAQSQLQNQQKVFDYNTQLKDSGANHIKHGSGSVNDYGQTPMSELSYSYSEMIGDMEGSNYMSSKMKLSTGGGNGTSYLKNYNQSMAQTLGNNINQFNNNYTITEEEEEKDSNTENSYSQSSNSIGASTQKKSYLKDLNSNQSALNTNQTPSFNSNFNPSHQWNQQQNIQRPGGVKIDILDDQSVSINTTANGQGSSLADAFRLKKQQLLQNRLGGSSQNQSQQTSNDSQNQSQKEVKREKTKEELAEIRKQMMKSKAKKQDNTSSSQSSEQQTSQQKEEDRIQGQLMSRLAKGEKVQVTKQEMLKLTSKNYELLPEVKKKKEEDKKKEELKERMRRVKALDQQRRNIGTR
eukprot:403331534